MDKTEPVRITRFGGPGTGVFLYRLRRRRWQKRLPALAALLVCLLTLIFAPFTASLRTKIILPAYDFVCEQNSLPHKLGLSVQMPLDRLGFYPLMITWSDDTGMSQWLQKPVQFTVDYAVADFDFLSAHSHSRFYDRDDALYGAYAGAYYLRGLGGPTDPDTVMQIATFDQRCLALPALGLTTERSVFRAESIQKSATQLAGLTWQRYDASIVTNGPEHVKQGFQTGYILFGDPPPAKENYPPPPNGRPHLCGIPSGAGPDPGAIHPGQR